MFHHKTYRNTKCTDQYHQNRYDCLHSGHICQMDPDACEIANEHFFDYACIFWLTGEFKRHFSSAIRLANFQKQIPGCTVSSKRSGFIRIVIQSQFTIYKNTDILPNRIKTYILTILYVLGQSSSKGHHLSPSGIEFGGNLHRYLFPVFQNTLPFCLKCPAHKRVIISLVRHYNLGYNHIEQKQIGGNTEKYLQTFDAFVE